MTSLSIKLSSPAFTNNGFIPSRHSYNGENISPQLDIDQVPEGTKSLALIVDDPDAPNGTWVHWVVWNIPVVKQLKENLTALDVVPMLTQEIMKRIEEAVR